MAITGRTGASDGATDRATALGLSRERSEIIARLERLPFTRFHFHAASILAAGTFFDAFDAVSIASVLTVIFTSLHIGFFNAGVLISAAYVGQFFGAWLFGFLSEAYGRKPAFVGAMLLFGLLSIATAFAWDFRSLAILRAIQGLGLGGEIPVAAALFNELLRTANRGRVSVTYQVMFQWGAMLTPATALLCFSLFGQDAGWRVMFLIGGLPAVVALYAWAALPESPRWLVDKSRYREADAILRRIEALPRHEPLPPPILKPQPEPAPTRLAELFEGIYARRTVVLWMLWFCAFFVTYGNAAWAPTLYVRIGGLTPNAALSLSIVTYAINVTTMYVQALLVDRVGRKPLLVAGFAISALAALAGALAIYGYSYTGWPILFGVTTAMGVGTAMQTILAFSYTAELYPTRMRGLGVATASSMSRLASVLAPSLVGAILAAQMGIDSVFAMFGVIALIGVAAVATMGIETKNRSLEELSP
jgi:MFS transporter, putative metabolite:H+ symporter